MTRIKGWRLYRRGALLSRIYPKWVVGRCTGVGGSTDEYGIFSGCDSNWSTDVPTFIIIVQIFYFTNFGISGKPSTDLK